MERLSARVAQILGSATLTRYGLASLPLLAGISYATNSTPPLLIAAFALPVALLGVRAPQARPYRQQFRQGGQDDIVALVDHAIATQPNTQRSAVLSLELDNSETLIDTWGSDGVEHIMSVLTDRLCGVLRTTDIVAKTGQTKFTIGLPGIRVPELGAVVALVERLQDAAHTGILIDHASAHVTLSAGFCLQERAKSRSGISMVEGADMALRDAQAQGTGAIRGFSKNTPEVERDGSPSGQDVLNALERGEIIAWFQPQISTDTGLVTGFEALARWDHPERGMLAPGVFLPALEAVRGMELLSETMLQHALRAIRGWDAAGLKVPTVAVNFATQDLRNPGLVERIKWDVDRFEIEPERLAIEILETVVAETEDDVITRNIRALGDQGFRIDLDDFGTGHASLSNIRRFAVNRIKIDRSFITHADEDPGQQRMVNAIIGMAEQLEIETVAEGVETLEEKGILSQLGCTHMQGYAIGKPMPFEETAAWMAKHNQQQNAASIFPRKTG
ncbi:diguanylate cyclase/phosphodiesterase [Litoreibacter ponti]|uniref:Diguanylate cyclase/phosphodiesterase n=1 Tax=Litoreibacter ponti TaxID=1510457 RepID=A0A2T6BEQ1_9RHOB|nr:bifunctional diguanylate cyclase/phosphodiesterase [Litoreibacter ponti]PTX54542.1 diguanylate cyclase/phosphodiesterase [Litoreibacter ponti]